MTQKKMHVLASLAHIVILAMIIMENVSALLQNKTVDDAYTGGNEGISLIYLPDGVWSQGNVCTGCTAHPDPSQTFNGTWHDTTSFHNDNLQRSIGFNFIGELRVRP